MLVTQRCHWFFIQWPGSGVSVTESSCYGNGNDSYHKPRTVLRLYGKLVVFITTDLCRIIGNTRNLDSRETQKINFWYQSTATCTDVQKLHQVQAVDIPL